MGELEPTLTMIIPTIGRPGLWVVLDQISRIDSVAEVIVVFEKGYFNRYDSRFKNPAFKKVRFMEGPRPGISANLNLGLQSIKTDYFGFFSDDDFWISADLNSEMDFLRSQGADLLFGASKMQRFFSNDALRPRVAIVKPSQVLETPWWRQSPFYLSLNNLIASSHVKNYLFNEELSGYEDIEWLLRLEFSGFKYVQNFTHRSNINIDKVRNSERDNRELRRNVFNHLKILNKDWAQKYIINIAPRNHILASNFSEILRISMEKRWYLGRNYFLKNIGVGFLQVFLSASLRITLKLLRKID